jgi:transcriptional regulator with XRE-family HTH domain
MPFGIRLKEIRDARGVSQKELADTTGISQQAISAWESQKRSGPGPEELFKLADALGVDCSAFRDEDPPAPKKPRKPKA